MKARRGRPELPVLMFAALATSVPAAAGEETIRDKTLVAWVLPANLTQHGGSVLTIDDARAHFDGLVFGELAARRWMAGSENFRRTYREQSPWPEETSDPKTLVQVAITYQGQQVTLLRNGQPFAKYTMDSPPQQFGPQSLIVMGKRHLDQQDDAHFAPESLLDDRGRRIMWAWIFDGPDFKARTDYGWSGTMSLPRVLSLAEDGTLRMSPPEEIAGLRLNGRKMSNLQVKADSELTLAGLGGGSIELGLEMSAANAGQYGIKVCRSAGGEEETLVFYDAVEKKLKVDTTRASLVEGAKAVEAGPFEQKADETLKLRVFVDRSVVEVFANGRQAVMRRIYPSRRDSLGVALFSRGGPASVGSLEAWDMMPSNPY